MAAKVPVLAAPQGGTGVGYAGCREKAPRRTRKVIRVRDIPRPGAWSPTWNATHQATLFAKRNQDPNRRRRCNARRE